MNAVSRYRREISVAVAYLFVLGILAIKAPAFFHQQFRNTWVEAAPVLVAGIGMTLIILAREIDISIGWQFSICGVCAGLAAKSGLPIPVAILCALLAGAVMGAFNGALVAFGGLPSIVVTLATMFIFQQGLKWSRQGEAVTGLPADFQWLGHSQHGGESMLILGAIALLVVFAIGSRWVAAGRTVYAVGSDREAARLAGVRPKRVIFTVFVLMGALVGLAAMLNAIRFPQVDPNAGNGLELQVIAAVVVGGTAISGGRGNLLGTLIGVALLITIGSALTFLKSSEYWKQAIQGAIILLAVASDGFARRNA
ncbi:MAG: ABC transporter permease [Planctomycetota bacterium]|nr:ABC transporter permease [Planctomycetota bacterium]